MLNLKNMSDKDLILSTEYKVQEERRVSLQVLEHFAEVERRRLYSELKYTSLFDFAVRHLKYSENQAMDRISSMRLMNEIPEVAEKIDSGALSMTSLKQARSFFNTKKKSVIP